MSVITTIEELDAIYGKPAEPSVIKEVNYLTAEYMALIEASPMMMLATYGPEGLDCSPRGDVRGFVRVLNKRTIVFPDRRGNNRVDSLRNIIHDNRVATLFLIPGVGTILRLNGTATISTDSELLESFAVEGKSPQSAVIISIDSVFFHCARSIVRSGMWNPETFVKSTTVPSPGQILAALTGDRHGGKKYDEEWPERAKETLW